ncbi:hypothetical protein [Streptomyces sp. NPDC007264]|uniref:hypothetical protein n=1 Tax=Streptomyces sp. NPDC007264 TaxID=3364777 RepID=UPI0036DAD322
MLKESDCPGQCASLKTAWDRDHPHLPTEFKDGGYAHAELRDGASSYCANYPGYVCITCGKEPSGEFMGTCRSCALRAEWDRWGYPHHPRWLGKTSPEDLVEYKIIATWPHPHERLTRIVGEIASTTGQHSKIIEKIINEELGVGNVRKEHQRLIRKAVVLALSWYYVLLQTDSELPS